MFAQAIRRGILSDENADLYFANRSNGSIVGTEILGDYSFISTLRALLANRVEGTFSLSVCGIYEKEDVAYIPAPTNGISLIYIERSSNAKRDEVMDSLKNTIDSFSGYKRVEKVTQYYGAAFKTYAWSNEETNSAIIATDSIDLRRIHILQACIPVVLPWLFVPDETGKKFTEDELKLLGSLDKKDSAEYLDALEKVAEQFRIGIKEVAVRKRLDGLSKRIQEQEISGEQRAIESIESDIASYYRSIESMLRDRQEHITRLFGLRARIKEGGNDTELSDYFICNKSMILGETEGTEVNFFVKGYLEYWDEDCAESTINNSDAYIYDVAGNWGYSREDAQRLFEAIFINRDIRIRYYAGYRLDIMGAIYPNARGDLPAELRDYMPNPHIARYDCLGDYKRKILECLQNGNIVAAFENCVSSAKSLNWYDGTVLDKFVDYMFSGQYKCFELPDGSVVGVREAVEWARS